MNKASKGLSLAFLPLCDLDKPHILKTRLLRNHKVVIENVKESPITRTISKIYP